MKSVVLLMDLASAVLAVLFVVYYIRIIARSQDVGEEPASWIAASVGFSLIASFAVLEAVLMVEPAEVVFNIQRVYFMLGNLVIFLVLYRIWRNVGGRSGW